MLLYSTEMGIQCIFEIGLSLAFGQDQHIQVAQATDCSDMVIETVVPVRTGSGTVCDVDVVLEPREDDYVVRVSPGSTCPQDLHVESWRMALITPTVKTGAKAFEPSGFGFVKTQQFAVPFPSLQFTSLFLPNECFYLGIHDGEAFPKQFAFDGVKSVSVTYAGSSEMEGNGFVSIPFRVTSLPGPCNWMDMADIYKSFAQKTKWFIKGLERRETRPAWLTETPLWINSHWQINDVFETTGGKPATVLKRVKEFKKLVGENVPMLLHWYEWDLLGYQDSDFTTCTENRVCGFDSHYPNYFPVREGFSDVVAELENLNVFTVPYINGRLFDKALSNWESDKRVKNSAVLKIDQTYIDENYGNNVHFAAMCPATTFWQQTVADIAGDLMDVSQAVRGIYIDEVAAAKPEACYNSEHEHALGGGSSWTSGYNSLMDKVRTTLGDDRLILTESNVEQLIGSVDTFLTLVAYENLDAIAPAFQYVYPGGVFTSAGAIFYQKDIDNDGGVLFMRKLMKMFMLGSQLGWMSLGGRENQKPPMGLLETLQRESSRDVLIAMNRLISQRMDPVVLRFFSAGGLMNELSNMGYVWRDATSALIILCNPEANVHPDIKVHMDLKRIILQPFSRVQAFESGEWTELIPRISSTEVALATDVQPRSCSLFLVEQADASFRSADHGSKLNTENS